MFFGCVAKIELLLHYIPQEDFEALAPGAKVCGGAKVPHFSLQALAGAKVSCNLIEMYL